MVEETDFAIIILSSRSIIIIAHTLRIRIRALFRRNGLPIWWTTMTWSMAMSLQTMTIIWRIPLTNDQNHRAACRVSRELSIIIQIYAEFMDFLFIRHCFFVVVVVCELAFIHRNMIIRCKYRSEIIRVLYRIWHQSTFHRRCTIRQIMSQTNRTVPIARYEFDLFFF